MPWRLLLTQGPRRLMVRNGGSFPIPYKLMTREVWPSRVAQGLQHMSVLCLRLFLPGKKKKKHLKTFSNISFFLLFIPCLKSSHTCSVSAERPQDGAKSSQSASADPQDPEQGLVRSGESVPVLKATAKE